MRRVVFALLLIAATGFAFICRSPWRPPPVREQWITSDDGRPTEYVGPDGRRLEFIPDTAGVCGLRHDGQTTTLTRDAEGRPIRVRNKAGQTIIRYDAFGRVAEVATRYSPEMRLRYQYDPWGRVSELSICGSGTVRTIAYQYDLLDRIRRVRDYGGAITRYTYDDANLAALRRLPNGITTAYHYDPYGRPIQVSHHSPGGHTIAEYRYKWDSLGRVAEARELTSGSPVTAAFRWDGAGRLTGLWRDGVPMVQRAFDPAGRVTREITGQSHIAEARFDSFGRTTCLGDRHYEYATAGDVSRYRGPEGSITLGWDSLHRVTSTSTGGVLGTRQFVYDGLGQPVAERHGVSWTHYLNLPSTDSGLALQAYDWRGSRCSWAYADGLHSVWDASGTPSYVLSDGLGAPRVFTDGAGRPSGQLPATWSQPSFAMPFSARPLMDCSATSAHATTDANGAGLVDTRQLTWDSGLLPPGLRSFPAPTVSSTIRGMFGSPSGVEPATAVARGLSETPGRGAGLPEGLSVGAPGAPRCQSPLAQVAWTPSPMAPCVASALDARQATGAAAFAPSWAALTTASPALRSTAGVSFGPQLPPPTRAVDDLLSAAGGDSVSRGREGSADVVIVGGVGNFGRNLAAFADVWPGQRTHAISTSCMRGLPATSDIDEARMGSVRLRDLGAAAGEYLLAFIEGYHGGDTGEHAWAQITANPAAHTISAFSRGGIVLYLQRDRLADAILDGRLSVTRIEMVGNGLATALRNYLQKRGVHGVEVVGIDVPDLVTPLSSPLWDSPFKAIAAAAQAIDFRRSLKMHNYETLTRTVHQQEPTSLADPWERLGGIDLSVREEMETCLGNLSGATYDPVSGKVTLSGGHDLSAPPVSYADFAVALRCVYQGQAPRFSLDPADASNPRGPSLRCVYYGPIEHTQWGADLQRADVLMKLWSCGRDAAGNRVAPPLSDFRDIFELTFAHGRRAAAQSWMRFWITVRRAALKCTDRSMRFSDLTLEVKTERMYQAASGALVSSGGEQDPIAESYAAYLTEHYDEIAAVEPSFARVRQLAAALALAQWLKHEGIEVDAQWLAEVPIPPVETPTIVPAVSASRSRTTAIPGGTMTHTIHLFGGVDLGFECTMEPAGDADGGAKSASPAPGDGDAMTALLPLTEADLAELDGASRTTVGADGVQRTYERGRLARALAPDGTAAEYGRDANGRLTAISTADSRGLRCHLSSNPDGSSVASVSTPTGHEIEAEWLADRRIRLAADGAQVGECTYSADGRAASFAYANGYTDTERYAADGALVSLERQYPDGTKECLGIVRDASGPVRQILIDGRPLLEYSSDGEGTDIVSAPAPRARLRIKSDEMQVCVTDANGAGLAVKRDADGGQTSVLTVRDTPLISTLRSRQWSVVRLAGVAVFACRYDPEGRLEGFSLDGATWARIAYDKNGRPVSASLPDGRRVTYDYHRGAARNPSPGPVNVLETRLLPTARRNGVP